MFVTGLKLNAQKCQLQEFEVATEPFYICDNKYEIIRRT